MTTVLGQHPVLGPGFSGVRSWVWAALLLLFAFGCGLALTYLNPVYFCAGLVALVGAAVFFWSCLTYPLATLCFVVLCQIIVPVYIRLPLKFPPALLMLALLTAIIAAQRMLKPVPTKHGKYQRLVATSLLIYNIVLLITIPNEQASIKSLFMYIKTGLIPASLFFVFLAIVRGPTEVRKVLNTVTLGAVMCGALGVHEYLTQNNFVADLFAPEVTMEEDIFLWILNNADEYGSYADGATYRVFSFFTQPLEYSAFMVMSFPFAALVFVTARNWSIRIIYGLATLIIFAGFIVSFSRGPTIALALVILFLGVYERKVRPWILAGGAVLTAAIIAYLPQIIEKLGDRITSTENVTLRFSLWENGIKIFLDNPIRGVGYGSYPNYHVQAIRDNQIGPMYEYSWSRIESVTTVENIFISLAAETGLLGLSAFALLLGASFYIFKKLERRFRGDEKHVLVLAAGAACLSFLLSGMTVANIIGYTISTVFFGVYIASLAVLSRELPDRDSPHSTQPSSLPNRAG